MTCGIHIYFSFTTDIPHHCFKLPLIRKQWIFHGLITTCVLKQYGGGLLLLAITFDPPFCLLSAVLSGGLVRGGFSFSKHAL
jgi:hypothetical protein